MESEILDLIKQKIENFLDDQFNKILSLSSSLNTENSMRNRFYLLKSFPFEYINKRNYQTNINKIFEKLIKGKLPKKKIYFLFNENILSEISELLNEIINWSRLPKRARKDIVLRHSDYTQS